MKIFTKKQWEKHQAKERKVWVRKMTFAVMNVRKDQLVQDIHDECDGIAWADNVIIGI